MILVLAPDVSEETLNEVVRRAQRGGARAHVSRGDEQTIVAIEGASAGDAVSGELDGLVECDVIPILSAPEYRLQRVRRTVLTWLATGLGLLTAFGAIVPVVGFLRPPRGTLLDPEVVAQVSADGLDPGQSRTVVVRGRPILLVAGLDGGHFALSALCRHESDCKLVWSRERGLLECPCHGDQFDRFGNVLRGPSSSPLTPYAVEVVDERIVVRRVP